MLRFSFLRAGLVALVGAVVLRLVMGVGSWVLFGGGIWRGWQHEFAIDLPLVGAGVLFVLQQLYSIAALTVTEVGIRVLTGRPLQRITIPWSAIDRVVLPSGGLAANTLRVWLREPVTVPRTLAKPGRDGEDTVRFLVIHLGLLRPGRNQLRAELIRYQPV
jgi:hypothetical protein